MKQLGFFALLLMLSLATALPTRGEQTPVPILVELFTSEGCSSCPPADRFLQELDTQPLTGAQFIVLSEHVDYWNHIGWTDPYSSSEYSDRQTVYQRRFHLDSVYTPQIIVNGAEEFVGNNAGDLDKAFAKAMGAPKVALRISDVSVTSGKVHVHVESDPLSDQTPKADVMLAVALNHAESDVARGENAGHRLAHVAVVRTLAKVGRAESGKALSQDATLKLPAGVDPSAVRIIAFLQEGGQGKVLGATQGRISK